MKKYLPTLTEEQLDFLINALEDDFVVFDKDNNPLDMRDPKNVNAHKDYIKLKDRILKILKDKKEMQKRDSLWPEE